MRHLSPYVTTQDVDTLFTPFGKVMDIYRHRTMHGNPTLREVLLDMEFQDAYRAMDALDGGCFKGKTISVSRIKKAKD